MNDLLLSLFVIVFENPSFFYFIFSFELLLSVRFHRFRIGKLLIKKASASFHTAQAFSKNCKFFFQRESSKALLLKIFSKELVQ